MKIIRHFLAPLLPGTAALAADEAAAREFREADPCLVAGVMTSELHPFGLALMAK